MSILIILLFLFQCNGDGREQALTVLHPSPEHQPPRWSVNSSVHFSNPVNQNIQEVNGSVRIVCIFTGKHPESVHSFNICS